MHHYVELIVLRREFNRSITVAWLLAALVAFLQARFFLSGFRLTGDEVLFENVLLQGDSLAYIAQTAAQQARIGHFIALPLLLIGSHFSNYFGFRVFYVALWYVDILLFSLFVARLAKVRVALPLFIAITVLQPMIGYHMPPVGYPLHLGVPLAIILAVRLLISPKQAIRPNDGKAIALRCIAWVIYALALISNEYMMIFGAIIVLMEALASPESLDKRDLRGQLMRYRLDVAILVLVYAAYLAYRAWQPSRYDGTTLDSVADHRDFAYTFFMHVASGTWLPFADASAVTRRALPGSIFSMILCATACMLYARSSVAKEARHRGRLPWLSCLSLLGLSALTLCVTAASKQQHWCTIDHNCSYLDSRLSLFLLVAAILLALLSLPRSSRFFKAAYGIAFVALTISAGACYAIGYQQMQGMRVASSAWTRARMIACQQGVDAISASAFIDPNHYIPMHSIMDRDAFWQSYMARLARDGDCLAQVRVPRIAHSEELSLGVAAPTRLGASAISLLTHGWSYPEAGNVWSLGTPAIIDAKIPSSTQPLALALQLIAYPVEQGQSQDVVVSVNDAQVAQWKVASDAAGIYTFDIPATVSRSGGRLQVRLDVAHPVSPLQRHESTDPRQLGVALSSIQLLPASATSTTR